MSKFLVKIECSESDADSVHDDKDDDSFDGQLHEDILNRNLGNESSFSCSSDEDGKETLSMINYIRNHKRQPNTSSSNEDIHEMKELLDDDSIINASSENEHHKSVINVCCEMDKLSFPSAQKCDVKPKSCILNWTVSENFYKDIISEKHIIPVIDEYETSYVALKLEQDDDSDERYDRQIRFASLVQQKEILYDGNFKDPNSCKLNNKKANCKFLSLKQDYEKRINYLESKDVMEKLQRDTIIKQFFLKMMLRDESDDLTQDNIDSLIEHHKKKIESFDHVLSTVKKSNESRCEEEEKCSTVPLVVNLNVDISEEQQKYISMRREQLGINELRLSNIESLDGNSRECWYCEINVGVLDWTKHIGDRKHKLNGILKKELCQTCWFGTNDRTPNDCMGDSCQDCLDRQRLLNETWFINYDEDTYDPDQGEPVDIDKKIFFCRSCNKYCDSAYFYESHMNSLLHALKSGNKNSKSIFFCKPCKLRLFTSEYYMEHLEGITHKRRIKELWGSSRQNENEVVTSPKRKLSFAVPTPALKKKKIN